VAIAAPSRSAPDRQRKTDEACLLDGALGGILYGGDYEIGHRAPLEFSGLLEHRVQVGAVRASSRAVSAVLAM